MVFQNNILAGASEASKSTKYDIDYSLRFNDDDGPYLHRTNDKKGNQRTWTMSYWIKRCSLGSAQYHWSCQAIGNTGATRLYCQFTSADKLEIGNQSATILQTNALFRDIAAWGHFVIQCNTCEATAADRMKVYYNGVRITSWATDNLSGQVAQNSAQEWNNNTAHNIGDDPNINGYMDGYFSEFHHIDGKVVAPTAFGETDDNGVWRPIEYDAGSVGSDVTITFVEQAKTDSSATTYTFSDATLGGSAGDHFIIGTTGRQSTASTNDITSVTVDGNAAVELVDSPGSTGTQHTGLWIAEGKGNADGDIVVVFGAACNAAAYAVWRATNVGHVGAFESKSEEASGGTDPSETITIPAGGALIAYADTNGSSKSFSWTNATERFDADAGDADNWHSGASDAFASHTEDRAITVDQGTTTSRAVFCSIARDEKYGTNGFYLDFDDANNPGLDANVAASSTTYRYLKMNSTSSTSSTYVGIGEMEYFVGSTLYPTQTMTSNTAPSPLVASANEDTGAGAELAFNAFDDTKSAGVSKWQTAAGTPTGFLKIDLGSGNGIAPTSFGIFAPETQDRTPREFTIQGSNDDSSYTVLGTYHTHTWESEGQRYWPLTTGNNWSYAGLATNDQVLDTPTLNYPTIQSTHDSDNNHTYSEGNLKVFDANTHSNDTTRISTMAIPSTGTWGVKMTCIAALEGHSIGVGDQHLVVGDVQGLDQSGVHGVFYNQLGRVFEDGTQTTTGKEDLKTANDVIECHIDMDAGDVEFFVNNSSQGSYDIPSGYDALGIDMFFYCDTGIGDNTLLFDFGQLGYDPSTNLSGSKQLNSANIPTPTIEDGTAHFQTTLYTGNTKVRNIDQTGNSTFQPDIVWIKNRDTTDVHCLYDAARGPAKEINPEDVRVENTNTQGVMSFSNKSWIDASSLTKIGDMTLESGLSHGFDGDSYKGFAECAAGTGTGYCGVDWGSGNTKTITQMVTFGSNDYGYSNPGRTITLAIEGSSDNSTFTDLGGGLTGLTDTTTDEHAKIITPTSTTAYRYHRAKVTSSAGSVHFAEVAFFEDTTSARKGFTLGSGNAGQNDDTEKFVAWQWKAGGGAGSSNTDGTLNTTTTSVNTTAGISVSTYTGGGSATTIGHGLGVAPKFIIQKERTNDVGSWHVYHAGLASDAQTDYITLDATSAKADLAGIWNDTAPTSTVLSLGDNDDVAGSSDTNVIYAFTDIVGFSKFGYFEGNNATNGPFIYLGFKPAWVMIKNIDGGSTNWNVFDIARQPQNLANAIGLRPNATQAEHTSSIAVDLLSNGFKCRDAGSDINDAVTYIFAAFAAHPFVGKDLSPATAI